MTGKVPVSHFIYTWPLVVAYSDSRYNDQLITELKLENPDVFVIQSGDATPDVTGQHRDSSEMLAEFPEVVEYIKDNYDFSKQIGRFSLYTSHLN